jgi:hypothetical protein
MADLGTVDVPKPLIARMATKIETELLLEIMGTKKALRKQLLQKYPPSIPKVFVDFVLKESIINLIDLKLVPLLGAKTSKRKRQDDEEETTTSKRNRQDDEEDEDHEEDEDDEEETTTSKRKRQDDMYELIDNVASLQLCAKKQKKMAYPLSPPPLVEEEEDREETTSKRKRQDDEEPKVATVG